MIVFQRVMMKRTIFARIQPFSSNSPTTSLSEKQLQTTRAPHFWLHRQPSLRTKQKIRSQYFRYLICVNTASQLWNPRLQVSYLICVNTRDFSGHKTHKLCFRRCIGGQGERQVLLILLVHGETSQLSIHQRKSRKKTPRLGLILRWLIQNSSQCVNDFFLWH